jgi:hypothetical protein
MSALKIQRRPGRSAIRLVPGWPESQIQGKGEVSVGEDLGFQPFAIDAARIDLGTVRQLVPAVEFAGGAGRIGDAPPARSRTRMLQRHAAPS